MSDCEEAVAGEPISGRKFSLWGRLSRLVHFRLVVPLKRSRHSPEHAARGVMVGLFWAFTPLVGVQMYLVFLTWLAARGKPRFEFSLIIGLAWTWVTNVFTIWPVYYAFYVTGRILLGRTEGATGYASFVAKWEAVLAANNGFIDSFLASVKLVAHDQGMAMAVGCLPYAVGTAWLGYYCTLQFIRRRRRERERVVARHGDGEKAR
jgi:uncharacterized protein (DUF2062 family)